MAPQTEAETDTALKDVYMSGRDDVRRCIETAVVEGMSKDTLKLWKGILNGQKH